MRRFLAHAFPVVGLLVAIMGAGPAAAADADPAGIPTCSIGAWLSDKDHKGLDIHAGPGTDTPIRARIPPPVKVADKELAIGITVTGWKDGWFRIDLAMLPKYVGAPKNRVVFFGEGWVFTRGLRLRLGDTYLYREPSAVAPLVAILDKDLPDGGEAGPDRFTVERLVGCRGDWAEVEGTYFGARLHGWTCTNEGTACARDTVAGVDAATAAGADPERTFTCRIGAWSTDKDPKGLNVRAGPGTGHPVIARLPPPRKKGDDAFATEVSVTGSQGGWFRIHKATTDNYVSEQGPKVVFKGTGWVSGRYLGLTLNRNNLYRDPSERAPVVAKLVNDKEGGGPDSFVVDRLIACRVDWVDVEGTFFGTRLRGWASGTCANQVTTCP